MCSRQRLEDRGVSRGLAGHWAQLWDERSSLSGKGAGSCENSHFSGDLIQFYTFRVFIPINPVIILMGCDNYEIKSSREEARGAFPSSACFSALENQHCCQYTFLQYIQSA